MATMTRTRDDAERIEDDDEEEDIAHGVPEPFVLPIELRVNGRNLKVDVQEHAQPTVSTKIDVSLPEDSTSIEEMPPTLKRVQQMCLTTLNNLLSPSSSTNWKQILPSRRHSMPQMSSSASQSSPLMTLLENLRTLPSAENQMREVALGSENDSTSLHRELYEHVKALAPSLLTSRDRELAESIVSVLAKLDRLATISPGLQLPESLSPTSPSAISTFEGLDIYDSLSRGLSDFQTISQDLQQPSASTSSKPIQAVETALLWHDIDTDLENVLRLCHLPQQAAQANQVEHLPPGYDEGDAMSLYNDLPAYDTHGFKDLAAEDKKTISGTTQGSATDEKMRLDLDSVALAIERFYLVAPQLHNQRVEPRTISSNKGKGKLKVREEGEEMLDLLVRANDRRLSSQTFTQSQQSELQVRQRSEKERAKFVEELLDSVGDRRMADQDAVFGDLESRRERREKERMEEMVSLPEFIKEEMPPPLTPSLSTEAMEKEKERKKLLKVGRSRSLSAPGLGWLLHRHQEKDKEKPMESVDEVSKLSLSIEYVAEHQEALKTVLVLLRVDGARQASSPRPSTPGKSPKRSSSSLPPQSPSEVSVSPESPNLANVADCSTPLSLPTTVKPGTYDIQCMGGWSELRIASSSSGEEPALSTSEPSLLTATDLESLKPTAIICASCSLPLLRCSGASLMRYFDLPSESWTELVEAWVCHPDSAHSHVPDAMKSGGKIWPKENQVMVGGSYLLALGAGGGGGVVEGNLTIVDLPDQLAKEECLGLTRCLCGNVVGRVHAIPSDENEADEGGKHRKVYRLSKYSIRCLGNGIVPKLSLSAFFVHDMHSHALHHAVWRFVVCDEESGRARFLIWLFKPFIRITYSSPASFATTTRLRLLSRQGGGLCAKVLYKVLEPGGVAIGAGSFGGELERILQTYPNFYLYSHVLSYPISCVRKLVGLLKESNGLYPVEMRVMTGLEVGFLERTSLED